MSLALYRKYRPRTFAEVIGQEHVTEPLSQALRSGRLHHAYLFSGPRGCGKTSSARILARSLNCEQGPTPEPCGVCASCRSLANDGTGSIDVIEIDAASHGGVDDARDLREKAFFAPASSRYKIYVIDEAHMVSSAGFNALLKLVEEPPEYVKFIFATTEPEKVLGTIRSRTHHYPFRLIPPAVLRPYLQQLTEAEGIPVEPAVFPLVVRAGGGSARDSLSVLDQLIAGAGPDGVSYNRAVALLGVTDVTLLDEMCDALAAGDGAAAFATIDRVAEAGHDPRRFASDLLERLRDLIVLQQVPDAVGKGLIDGPADQLDVMAAQATRLGPATLSRCADIVHTGLVDMRGTTAPRLLLELLTARMLLPGAEDSTGALLQRLERMERRLTLAPEAAAPGSAPAASIGSAPGGAVADGFPTAPAAGDFSSGASGDDGSASGGSADAGFAGAGFAGAGSVGAGSGSAGASGGGASGGGGLSAARAAAAAAGRRGAGAAPGRAAGGQGASAQVPALAAGTPAPSGPSASGGASVAAEAAPVEAVADAAGASSASVGVASLPSDVSSVSGHAVSAMPEAPGASGDVSHASAGAAEQLRAPEPVAEEPYYDDEPPWDDEPEPDPIDDIRPASPAAPAPAVAPPAPAVTPVVSPSAQDAVAPARRVEPRGVLPDAPEEPAAAAVNAAVPGRLDVTAVREVWPEIVTAIGRQSKKVAALVSGATVRDLDGDTVVLTFRFPAHARMVAPEASLISGALYEALGGRWQIRFEIAGDGAAATPSGSAPRQNGGGRSPSGNSAAPRDAGPRDAGPRDAGPRDAGPRDSGPRDSGPRDPGGRDAGARNVGRQVVDASREQAGVAQTVRASERAPQTRRRAEEAPSGGDDDWPEPAKPGGLTAAAPAEVVDDDEEWPEVRAIGGVTARPIGGVTARPADGEAQVGAREVDSPVAKGEEVGSPEGVGSDQVSPQEVSPQEVGSPQVGSLQVGSLQVGSLQVGSPQVGSPQVGSPQVGSPQVGSPQVGSQVSQVAPGSSLRLPEQGGSSGGETGGESGADGMPAGSGPATAGSVPAESVAAPEDRTPGREDARSSAGISATGTAGPAGPDSVPVVAAVNSAPVSSGAQTAGGEEAAVGRTQGRNAGPGSGLAAARAAAAGARGAGTRQPAKPTTAKAPEPAWSDGSPTEEAPYDPEFDGPRSPGAAVAKGGFDGFDPGDEPLDDVIDEKTARESSEQQAVRLLQEAFGAEKIGEA